MNGDPNKPEVTAAQAYFAERTHLAEVIDSRMTNLPVSARGVAAVTLPHTRPSGVHLVGDGRDRRPLYLGAVHLGQIRRDLECRYPDPRSTPRSRCRGLYCRRARWRR